MRFLLRCFARSVFLLPMLVLTLAASSHGQGTVARITVHSAALEGNLIGDTPDRAVSLYLPPSYHAAPERRYPVVYLLHGFTDTDAQWFGGEGHWIDLPAVLDAVFGEDAVPEMIVVMPNGHNPFGGSMYSNSVTVGDWETFLAEELVAHIDGHYRTIPEAASRGLAGHSMGGYGTLRVGMKHPGVFSSLYALSPCCLAPGLSDNAQLIYNVRRVETRADVAGRDFFTLATLASLAAWAPNPARQPLFYNLPWDDDGAVRPAVAARMAANALLVMMDQHIPALKRHTALALDVGLGDWLVLGGTQVFHAALDAYGIAHAFHTYDGGHVDRIPERLRTHTFPFFATHLAF